VQSNGLCLISKIIVFWTCNTLPILTMWSPSLVGSLLLLSWIFSLLRLHPPQIQASLLFAFSTLGLLAFSLYILNLVLLFLIRA
jgi:hypothetical protein